MPNDLNNTPTASHNGGGIIERVTIMIGPLTGMAFLRHTIDIAPAEGTVGFVEGEGWRCAGKFRNGEWRRMSGVSLARQVTHWSILDMKPKA